jgi:hypothetical protein
MPLEIISELETALGESLRLLNTFNEKEMNTVPFEGSWTPAQVCRHMFKSEDGMDQLLYAPSGPAERNPEERAAGLKATFLDFEHKMKSPGFILPEEKEYKREELTGPLAEIKDKMLDAAKTVDLTEMAPLPDGHQLKGTTKLELVHFITYHTIRHNHQLRKIREKLQ